MDMSKTFSQIKSYARLNGLPLIPVNANDISIINSPDDFYGNILKEIQAAKSRITLSALYLGTGHKEVALAHEICNNIKENPKLKVNIALDANRAHRVDANNQSSISVLNHLNAYDAFNLRLIDTGRAFGFVQLFLSKFKKLKELFSTYHSKALVFDNNVIITGANLSHIYFDKRQDRYMLIENSRLLSDYISGIVCEFKQPDLSFARFIRDYNDSFLSGIKNLETEKQNETHDSYLMPLFQHRNSGLTDFDDFLKYLMSALPKKARIFLSSGYFNPYLDFKLNSVLAPSESANGFHQGSGLLKYVPRLYTTILRQFAQSHPDCKLQLYNKPGWSFHAKGLWIENLDDIYIHFIGSSNFNWRSSTRDLETQYVMITHNSDLIRKLEAERELLWQRSSSFDPNSASIIYDMFLWIFKSFL